jgi:DsbC/DsbD-like thiol-disulfide interchange protein
VEVVVRIKKGWHIYANPAVPEDLKPTTLTLVPGQDAELVKVTYPKGEAKVLASSGEAKVSVYEGDVSLSARVKLGPSLQAQDLKFQLRYQACDDRACLAPATLSVSVSSDAERK